ncbi:asparagine synthase (glutamine-hydrolyzing) [Limnobacter sp.]|uniref:asparagine synthase (glutamine-hydrolyzing) n=1 Tax=Limnobacter sp. TaxID=2003368 RepID=UPI00351360D5
MCGIAGIATWRCSPALFPELKRMTDPITHRGPDDSGIWTDNQAGIGLGQRRLSIIDLSPHGHQPMISASGRWVLSYNGEIYNFAELRSTLEQASQAPVWRGHSDTEVLLGCVEAWGIEATLHKVVGMFAISLWDRQRKVLTLARDRVGEKPLYYGRVGDRVLFGSELKALTAVAGGALEIDREAVSEFLRFAYLPAPRSIWKGIQKLPPGHWLELCSVQDADKEPVPFWSLGANGHAELAARLAEAPDDQLVDEVQARLTEAIRLQIVADVPLGAFLSGGVDSSTVVALMQKLSSRPVRTFTIGFDQPEFNEAPFAKEVARHLGTEHTELYVTAKDAEQLIPRLPGIYDEPFADSSQIPTTLVSHLTKQHVTVSLSGDGGDELFAGYPRYALTANLWRKVNGLPLPLRKAASAVLGTPSAGAWDKVLSVLPASKRQSINGRRIHRLAQLLVTRSLGEMYVRLMSQWQPEENLVLGLPPQSFTLDHWDDRLGPIEAMRRWDVGQYLPDDLLVKVDRASMNASLEARAPLLDHRVVELAFALPGHALTREGAGKWALRQVLYRHVPKALIERPKTGFSVPLAAWLRGPLRQWAEDLLSESRLRDGGLLDARPVRTLWQEHLSGQFDRSSYLWNVLMFQAWRSANAGQ